MIVITTPTGQIGGRLLQILLDETRTRDEELRVIVRDPGRLPDGVRARVDVVTGSHGDAEVVDRAFDGADAVFWLVPSNPREASLDAMYSASPAPPRRRSRRIESDTSSASPHSAAAPPSPAAPGR